MSGKNFGLEFCPKTSFRWVLGLPMSGNPKWFWPLGHLSYKMILIAQDWLMWPDQGWKREICYRPGGEKRGETESINLMIIYFLSFTH